MYHPACPWDTVAERHWIPARELHRFHFLCPVFSISVEKETLIVVFDEEAAIWSVLCARQKGISTGHDEPVSSCVCKVCLGTKTRGNKATPIDAWQKAGLQLLVVYDSLQIEQKSQFRDFLSQTLTLTVRSKSCVSRNSILSYSGVTLRPHKKWCVVPLLYHCCRHCFPYQLNDVRPG